jgi:hypothetical protein
MVLTVFIGGGLGLLIGLAVLIGQTQAQEGAWRAIARGRRELGAWERELAAVAQDGECPTCRRRRRG